ncbi:MAG: hypothetical protein P4L58_04785, partial [Candidatus Pacebacteria bacterium]|nr:hypothetical protein [Candidatus Paceibacterota bacterium]
AALAIALINEWITFFWATMFCGILICFGFGRSVCENFALKKSRWKTPILVACCVHVAVSMLALTGYWLNSKSADMGAKLAAYEEIGPLLPKLESNLLPDLIAYDGAHYRSGALKIFSRYSDEPLDKAVLRSDIKLVFERFERRYGGGISKSCMPSGNIDDWQLWKNEGFVPELLSHLHRCESNDVVVPYAGMLFLNFDSATLKRLKELSGQLEKSFFLQYAKINPEIMSPRETLEWAKNNQIGLDNRKRALELYYVQTGNSITLDSIVRSPASIAPSKFSVIDCKSPWTPKTSPDEKIRAKFEQEEKFRITKCLSSELRSYAYDTSLFLFQSRTRGTGNFPIVSLRYASPYDTDARIGKLCKANSTSLYCVHNK